MLIAARWSDTSPKSPLKWIAAIAVATLLIYIPALRAGWIWDDNHYVTENTRLLTLHGLRELWLRPGAVPQYYPVTHTTFWIEHHLWGNAPFGYHLDNVLLHIANAVMVGLILRRLQVRGYILAAAIFALHPVHVESVAWVTERKNVLSGFFYLLAVWTALDVWQIAPGPDQKVGRKYWLCLMLFVLALLSKSVTATFAPVILLLIWWKRCRCSGRDIGLLIPFFLLGAGMGLLTSWMEQHIVGASGPEWNWTIAQRLLIAGRAIWFYLGKIFWPYPLMFIYPKWQLHTASLPQQLLLAAVIGAMAICVLLLWRGIRWPLISFAFFVVTIFPALGFANVYPMRYSFVADHFQYLASIAPIAVAGAFLSRWRRIGVLILVSLGILSWQRGEVFHDSVTLWRDVVAKDPSSPIGHVNLGVLLNDPSELHEVLVASPDYPDAWDALGSIAKSQGNQTMALQYYRSAVTVAPGHPVAWYELGMIERQRAHLAAAIANFAMAADRLPNPAPAYEQMGEIELIQSNPEKARAMFNQALAYDPDLVNAHNDLAAIDLAIDSLNLAQQQCDAALAIDPDNVTACNNMGIALARQGQADQAAEYFAKVLAIDPGNPLARQNLEKLGKRP